MSTIPVSAELLIELRDAANEALNRAERQYRIDHYAKLVAQADELLASPQDSAGAVCDTCHGRGEVYSGEDQHFHYFDFQPPEPIMEVCPECGGGPITTPQPAGQAVEVAGQEDVERQIVGRYTVHPTGRGFWPYCVRAGDGERELFVGHKRKCDEVAAALQAACLDGAFMQAAMLAAAPQPAQQEPCVLGGTGISASIRGAMEEAQQPNPDVARLREALDEVRRRCSLPDWARERIDTALDQTSGGE